MHTVPYAPLSHPFVERLIGTIRRECLDRTLFWTGADLETKLLECSATSTAIAPIRDWTGSPPESTADRDGRRPSIHSYHGRTHGRGLYQTPIAA